MRSLTGTAGAASGGQPEASGRACQRPSIAQAVLGILNLILKVILEVSSLPQGPCFCVYEEEEEEPKVDTRIATMSK